MDYINVKIEQNVCEFNWDDIEVGDNHLDHSENFFARKHFKHEKLDDLDLVNEQMASAGLDEADKIFGGFNFDVEKENDAPLNEQQRDQLNNIKSSPAGHVNLNQTPDGCKEPTLVSTQPPVLNTQSAVADDLTLTAAPFNNNVAAEHVVPALDVTVKPKRAPANIACMWSSQKPFGCKPVTATGASGKSMPPPPHAYEFKDVYERKKLEAQRRRLEEERKMRQFRSRPAPNFNNFHEQKERQKVVHAVTMAVTPQVLKNSRESDEKRRKKLEEWKRQHQPPKFESREPNVLKEKPFVPKKSQTVIQPKPFNLHSERRLQERKQYDAAAKTDREEKQKQEEEERKKREEERVRELRKIATFKARPNPFK